MANLFWGIDSYTACTQKNMEKIIHIRKQNLPVLSIHSLWNLIYKIEMTLASQKEKMGSPSLRVIFISHNLDLPQKVEGQCFVSANCFLGFLRREW